MNNNYKRSMSVSSAAATWEKLTRLPQEPSANAELGVDIRLEGVAASCLESAQNYQAKFGFRHAFKSAEALLQDNNIDAIIIASPQHTHLRFVELAAASGKAILCEKPMGRNLAEAKKISEIGAHVPNMVGYNYIQTPATALAREVLSAGDIGEVIWYRGEHHEDFWSMQREMSGGRLEILMEPSGI